MGDETEHTREDDRFMRNVMRVLITALITIMIASVSGFFVLYGQVQANSMALERYAEDARTMVDIKVLVAKLVANSVVRNEADRERNIIMREERKRNDYMFGEQKRRRPAIDSVFPHINDRTIHN